MKIKNRTITAIVLALVFAVLVAVYFIFVHPIIMESADGTVHLDLLDGEIPITDKLTTFYIFEPIPRSAIKSIKVENEYGGFTVSRDTKAASSTADGQASAALGEFKLNGYSSLPFDDNKLASLIVTTGTPIAMMRVSENLGDDKAALSEYGLDLHRVNMHWLMFGALFRGLPDDCRLKQIIGIRAENLSEIKDKNERQRIAKLQRIYSLGPVKKRYKTLAERDAAMLEDMRRRSEEVNGK